MQLVPERWAQEGLPSEWRRDRLSEYPNRRAHDIWIIIKRCCLPLTTQKSKRKESVRSRNLWVKKAKQGRGMKTPSLGLSPTYVARQEEDYTTKEPKRMRLGVSSILYCSKTSCQMQKQPSSFTDEYEREHLWVNYNTRITNGVLEFLERQPVLEATVIGLVVAELSLKAVSCPVVVLWFQCLGTSFPLLRKGKSNGNAVCTTHKCLKMWDQLKCSSFQKDQTFRYQSTI